ncbi:MAG: glycosyltransferase [Methylacidiphilales bacterium]|nr:glycosyltransferase [Candidatus Methylacidiphilales bacterium]
MLRVDLQLHSRFSDRPSEWILRRLGMPQSYSEPEALYRKLASAGMTFKTITDHNRLDGAKAIAHYADAFLSEEVTTYFPDGCKIHLLVWNLSEAQHEEIQRLRPNIYELAAYLRHEKLPHGVAHPLVNINQVLTVEHFERLVLLFRCFEARNGNREPLAQEVGNRCLESLTPEKVIELANRHNLEPTHAHAHRKVLFASSDDHSGLHPGRTFTEVEKGETVRDFFRGLEEGAVLLHGPMGDPLTFSSSLYTTVFSFARDKIKRNAPMGANLLGQMAERFLAGQNPTAFSFAERFGHIAESIRTGQALDFVKPGETTLARDVAAFVSNPKLKKALDQIIADEPNAQRRSFRMASHISNELTYRLITQFQGRLGRGNLIDAFQSLTGLLPVGVSILPYLVAFAQQAPDRSLLTLVARRFTGTVPLPLRNEKRAWFTDTLEDVNGVARTIRAMVQAAGHAGAGVTVVTSRSKLSITDIPIKNFPPVGEFEIPEYELQKLSFPPFLDMLDYIQRERFTELIISTPGPIGLCALGCAKLLGLRTSGIYHTDFPQYARFLSDDAFMETIVWNYMRWFYGQTDLVYVNSEFYRRCWIDRGIPPEKLRIFPRGLDTELFNPALRDSTFWPKRGAEGPVLLYVGRVSREKDLNLLVEIVPMLHKAVGPFTLAIVGEGPYRAELEKLLPGAIFTGILTGRELGVAYASADLFVFPSTTDTYGNVVVEAMAAGLPVAVSDVGGPRELVKNSQMGRIFPARDATAWVTGLAEMIAHLPSTQERLNLARLAGSERRWDSAFARFWHDGNA